MEMDSSPERIQIYVRLLNEGTEVSRPTEAVSCGGGLYRLLPTAGYDPDDEEWEFFPGSVVRAVRRTDGLGEFLLAGNPD